MESTKAKLDKEQKESGEKYEKNVDFLMQYMDDANNQRSKSQFYMKKVKGLEEKLCAFVSTSEELDPSTQLGKRDSTLFSSSREEGLQTPPKQHRALK